MCHQYSTCSGCEWNIATAFLSFICYHYQMLMVGRKLHKMLNGAQKGIVKTVLQHYLGLLWTHHSWARVAQSPPSQSCLCWSPSPCSPSSPSSPPPPSWWTSRSWSSCHCVTSLSCSVVVWPPDVWVVRGWRVEAATSDTEYNRVSIIHWFDMS